MRDYSNLLDRTIEWKSNDEIKRFEKSYKNYIIALLRKQNIDDFYCNTLFNDILIKYASGKINYDKTMGKFETFLYRITSNTAQDFLRERKRAQDRETEIDNANTSTFYEITHNDNQTFEYFRLIAVETLKRLWKKVTGNKVSMEIFTRRCFANESIERLSSEYKKSKNEVSTTVSRMHSRYKQIFNEVKHEMEIDRMKCSSAPIDFLEPIMDFSLSITEIGMQNIPIVSRNFAA